MSNLANENSGDESCSGKLKMNICAFACTKKCCKKYKRGKKPCKSCPKQ